MVRLNARHRLHVADLHPGHRDDQTVAQHQQRGLLEVRDEPEQEVLVAELRQHPALLVDAEPVVRVNDDRETVAAAGETRRGQSQARAVSSQ